MIWSDDTLSPAKARPAVIESAAQMVIAFNPENLTKLVIVVILFVTRPPLWRLDAPNIGQVHRDECDEGHMEKIAARPAFGAMAKRTSIRWPPGSPGYEKDRTELKFA